MSPKQLLFYIELVEQAEVAIDELTTLRAPRADLLLIVKRDLRMLKDDYEDKLETIEYIPGDDKED